MVSGAQSQAPSIVLLAWRPLWGGVWYTQSKSRGGLWKLGEAGERRLLFCFSSLLIPGVPSCIQSPSEAWAAWGLLGRRPRPGPWPLPGCRDALGPPDKGNQFWVLPAAKLTPPPLKRFSQPGRCNCVFQLINPRWLWHKARRLHRAERSSRRIPQVPAAWRLETKPPVVPQMPHLFTQAL